MVGYVPASATHQPRDCRFQLAGSVAAAQGAEAVGHPREQDGRDLFGRTHAIAAGQNTEALVGVLGTIAPAEMVHLLVAYTIS
jgi:hypothetical protein